MGFPVECDDGTLPADTPLGTLSGFTIEAGNKLGRPIALARNYKTMMEAAGFADVALHMYKWPTNQWPRDRKFKTLGLWTLANIGGGI